MTDPDPRTAAEDDEDAITQDAPADDATNRGRSAEAPAEGADDDAPEQPGSPRG